MSQRLRPRSGSRYEPLQRDDAGHEPWPLRNRFQLFRSTSFNGRIHERPERRSVRFRSLREERPQYLQTQRSQLETVLQEQDNLELQGLGEKHQVVCSDGSIFWKYEPQYTTNIDEDIGLLRDLGYTINYPDGQLGSGVFGVVYKGHFNRETDENENLSLPKDVDPICHVAIKVVDLKSGSQSDADPEYLQIEKYILTEINHKNVIKIYEIIDMGERNAVPYIDEPGVVYYSADRTYFIMEYADRGPLSKWLVDNYHNWEPSPRIKIMKDMFSGMRHLHQNKILHGDVHPGNVLIFSEANQLVAKWTDFGLSKIAGLKPYRHRKTPQMRNAEFPKGCREDTTDLLNIFVRIFLNRDLNCETPQECKQLDELQRLAKIKIVKPLDVLFAQFAHILQE